MTREERAAAKEAKRQANKENWPHHPANANAAWMQRRAEEQAAKLAAPIEAEAGGDTGGSRSLQELKRIMRSASEPLFRRVEAAEIIAGFELPAGGAVGVNSEFVTSTAFKFLQRVTADPQTPEGIRFKSLRLVAGYENARARAVQGVEQIIKKRELQRSLCNSERRRCLLESHRWPPPDGAEWSLKPDDQFPWLPDWPGSWSWPIEDFGLKLGNAMCKPIGELLASERRFRAELRSIRSTNRDDRWELLLSDNAA
jgi:hypothetical protein